MQPPSRSTCSAAAIAAMLFRPRSIGICPMLSRTFATSGFFQSSALASARSWRRWRAAYAIATGSQLLS
jgi:hypothetical protein